VKKLTRNTNTIFQKFSQLVFAATLFLMPVATFAATIPTPDCGALNGVNCSLRPTGFTDTLVKIINIALGVVFIIAVAMLIYGAFQYVVAGGNEKAVDKGKKIIINALIGIAIIILSYVIVSVVARTAGNIGGTGPI
jgi:hypothetical protein